MKSSKRRKRLKMKKFVSFILLQAFLFYNVSFATIDKDLAARENNDPAAKISIDNISVSKDVGAIKARHKGKNGKLIIHLQDAHCNYEAQQNIAKILEHLVKHYGVNFVAVEGADGIVDTGWFKAFPDAEIRKEVADYFMKKGEITGAEFLSITSDYPFTIYGAEDRKYYIENLNSFLESYPYKEEFHKYYANIKTALQKLKKFIYTDELIILDRKINAHKAKDIKFADYAAYLNKTAKSKKINVENYKNFNILTETLRYEKDINFDTVNEERARLIDELSKILPKDTLSELVNKSLEFKLGKIEANDFYTYLAKLAKENNISLSGKYNNLVRYIIYSRIYSRIENEKLFDEIDLLTKALKEKMFTNEPQRTLDTLWTNVNIIIGFMNIELTNKEYEYYLANKGDFSPDKFDGFLKQNFPRFGISYDTNEAPSELTYIFPKLVDFYEIATKRDEILIKNMFKGMHGKKTDVAVLITGGFHTKGIAKTLKEKDVSYVVLSPAITKETESPYISVLTGQKTPFEELLVRTGENTKLLQVADKICGICMDRHITNGRINKAGKEFYTEIAEKLIKAYVRIFPDKPENTIKNLLIKNFKTASKNCPNKTGSKCILKKIKNDFDNIYHELMEDPDNVRGLADNILQEKDTDKIIDDLTESLKRGVIADKQFIAESLYELYTINSAKSEELIKKTLLRLITEKELKWLKQLNKRIKEAENTPGSQQDNEIRKLKAERLTKLQSSHSPEDTHAILALNSIYMATRPSAKKVDDVYEEIYKKQDIRGNAQNQLTDKVVRNLAGAYAKYIKNRTGKKSPVVAIGKDVRISSKHILNTLAAALTAKGIEVVNIGRPYCTTPMVTYALMFNKRIDAGIMISASHLEAVNNGLKFVERDRERDTLIDNMSPKDLKNIINMAKNGDTAKNAAVKGVYEIQSVMPRYINELTRRMRELTKKEYPLKGKKIAIDAGNGVGGFFTEVLRQLGADVFGINIEPDGTFPMHLPNPDYAWCMTDLSAMVRAEKLYCGIAFDADGDRTGFVSDGEGGRLSGDDLLNILSKQLMEEDSSRYIIINVRSTQATANLINSLSEEETDDFIIKEGSDVEISDVRRDKNNRIKDYKLVLKDTDGKKIAVCQVEGHVIWVKLGYVYIKEIIKWFIAHDVDIVVGMETSGHIMWTDIGNLDDGMYSAVTLLGTLINNDVSLSASVAMLPNYENPGATITLKPISGYDEKKKSMLTNIEKVTTRLPYECHIDNIDGRRFIFKDSNGNFIGKVLFRVGMSKAQITVDIEAIGSAELLKILNAFITQIKSDRENYPVNIKSFMKLQEEYEAKLKGPGYGIEKQKRNLRMAVQDNEKEYWGAVSIVVKKDDAEWTRKYLENAKGTLIPSKSAVVIVNKNTPDEEIKMLFEEARAKGIIPIIVCVVNDDVRGNLSAVRDSIDKFLSNEFYFDKQSMLMILAGGDAKRLWPKVASDGYGNKGLASSVNGLPNLHGAIAQSMQFYNSGITGLLVMPVDRLMAISQELTDFGSYDIQLIGSSVVSNDNRLVDSDGNLFYGLIDVDPEGTLVSMPSRSDKKANAEIIQGKKFIPTNNLTVWYASGKGIQAFMNIIDPEDKNLNTVQDLFKKPEKYPELLGYVDTGSKTIFAEIGDNPHFYDTLQQLFVNKDLRRFLGVFLTKEGTIIGPDVQLGNGVTVEAGSAVLGNTKIMEGTIKKGTVIINSVIARVDTHGKSMLVAVDEPDPENTVIAKTNDLISDVRIDDNGQKKTVRVRSNIYANPKDIWENHLWGGYSFAQLKALLDRKATSNFLNNVCRMPFQNIFHTFGPINGVHFYENLDFVKEKEVTLNLTQRSEEKAEAKNEISQKMAELVNAAMDALEHIVARNKDLKAYYKYLISKKANRAAPIIRIKVAEKLLENTARYYNAATKEIEIILNEKFINSLISAYDTHPAVKYILAERLFHELGHSNTYLTEATERAEEKFLILRDLELHALISTTIQQDIDEYLKSKRPDFPSGYYFKFLNELLPLGDGERVRRIHAFLTGLKSVEQSVNYKNILKITQSFTSNQIYLDEKIAEEIQTLKGKLIDPLKVESPYDVVTGLLSAPSIKLPSSNQIDIEKNKSPPDIISSGGGGGFLYVMIKALNSLGLKVYGVLPQTDNGGSTGKLGKQVFSKLGYTPGMGDGINGIVNSLDAKAKIGVLDKRYLQEELDSLRIDTFTELVINAIQNEIKFPLNSKREPNLIEAEDFIWFCANLLNAARIIDRKFLLKTDYPDFNLAGHSVRNLFALAVYDMVGAFLGKSQTDENKAKVAAYLIARMLGVRMEGKEIMYAIYSSFGQAISYLVYEDPIPEYEIKRVEKRNPDIREFISYDRKTVYGQRFIDQIMHNSKPEDFGLIKWISADEDQFGKFYSNDHDNVTDLISMNSGKAVYVDRRVDHLRPTNEFKEDLKKGTVKAYTLGAGSLFSSQVCQFAVPGFVEAIITKRNNNTEFKSILLLNHVNMDETNLMTLTDHIKMIEKVAGKALGGTVKIGEIFTDIIVNQNINGKIDLAELDRCVKIEYPDYDPDKYRGNIKERYSFFNDARGNPIFVDKNSKKYYWKTDNRGMMVMQDGKHIFIDENENEYEKSQDNDSYDVIVDKRGNEIRIAYNNKYVQYLLSEDGRKKFPEATFEDIILASYLDQGNNLYDGSRSEKGRFRGFICATENDRQYIKEQGSRLHEEDLLGFEEKVKKSIGLELQVENFAALSSEKLAKVLSEKLLKNFATQPRFRLKTFPGNAKPKTLSLDKEERIKAAAKIFAEIKKRKALKPAVPLDETKNESKREFIGSVDGSVVEELAIQMGDILASEPVAINQPQVLFVEEGEISILGEDGKEIMKAAKGEFIEAPLGKYEIRGTATSVINLVYEPAVDESQVVAGYEAIKELLSRKAFVGAKPIIVHEPAAMHAKDSFVLSKRMIKTVSNGAVQLKQYGRTVEDLADQVFDTKHEHVFVVSAEDLKKINKPENETLRDKLSNVLTRKIIPVRIPEDETKGVSNALEIETAAVVLGLTDMREIAHEQLSGNALTLQRIMSALVGENVTPGTLLALMGAAPDKIAERIALILKKLVPLTEEIRKEVRARRELLWSL